MRRHSSSNGRWRVNQRLLACWSALISYWSLWARRPDICWRRRSHLLWLGLLHLVRRSDSSCSNFFLFFSLLCRIENLGSVWRRLVETLTAYHIAIGNDLLNMSNRDWWSSNWCLMNWVVWRDLLILRHGCLLKLSTSRNSLSIQWDFVWLIVPKVCHNCGACSNVRLILANSSNRVLVRLLLLNWRFIPLLVLLMLLNGNWRLRICEIRVLAIKLASLLNIRSLLLLCSLWKIASCLVSPRCSCLISLILLLLSIALLRHLHANLFDLVGHGRSHKLLSEESSRIRVENSIFGKCHIRLLRITN